MKSEKDQLQAKYDTMSADHKTLTASIFGNAFPDMTSSPDDTAPGVPTVAGDKSLSPSKEDASSTAKSTQKDTASSAENQDPHLPAAHD